MLKILTFNNGRFKIDSKTNVEIPCLNFFM